jgi:hypothetical protein
VHCAPASPNRSFERPRTSSDFERVWAQPNFTQAWLEPNFDHDWSQAAEPDWVTAGQALRSTDSDARLPSPAPALPRPGVAPGAAHTVNPCPSEARLGATVRFNHASLPASERPTFRTYLGVLTKMDLFPAPRYAGCIQERVTLLANNCPAAVTNVTAPCTGRDCLPVGVSGVDKPTGARLTAGPSAFLDRHRSASRISVLEGTGVNACSYTCLQTYTCSTAPGARPLGVFTITRNLQADAYTPPGGQPPHITTGAVDKRDLTPPTPPKGDFPIPTSPPETVVV